MFFRYALGVAVSPMRVAWKNCTTSRAVAVDRAVRLVVDDEIEVERRELFAVAAVDHQRLNGRNHHRRAEQVRRCGAPS